MKVDLKEMHSVASWPEPRVESWQLRALLRVARAAKALAASGEYEGELEWDELHASLSDIKDSADD